MLDWLHNCHEDVSKDRDDGQVVCSFEKQEDIYNLPWLTFRLSEDGKLFALPLSSLVTIVTTLQEDRTGNVLGYEASLCIIKSKQFYSHDKDKIIFGILPMENFYIVVDAEEYRVGLYQYHEVLGLFKKLKGKTKILI